MTKKPVGSPPSLNVPMTLYDAGLAFPVYAILLKDIDATAGLLFTAPAPLPAEMVGRPITAILEGNDHGTGEASSALPAQTPSSTDVSLKYYLPYSLMKNVSADAFPSNFVVCEYAFIDPLKPVYSPTLYLAVFKDKITMKAEGPSVIDEVVSRHKSRREKI